MFGRNKDRVPAHKDENRAVVDSPGDDEKYSSRFGGPTKAQVKRATRTRLIFSLFTSLLLLIAVVFLILVELGNTQINSTVLKDIYFIQLDLTNIIPQTVPDSAIINSIARTLGLHDFYQVGLWNFCEGYNDQGVTYCSTPQLLWWFNPVSIIQNELLAGATITLPADVTNILDLIRLVSNWMFGLFLTSACLSFVLIFTSPLSVFSRWIALFNAIFSILSSLFVIVAAGIATAMFVIMRNAFTSVAELNINATLGTRMYVFVYIAVGATVLAALIQMGECCCCASRRDVRKGKKTGSSAAYR